MNLDAATGLFYLIAAAFMVAGLIVTATIGGFSAYLIAIGWLNFVVAFFLDLYGYIEARRNP